MSVDVPSWLMQVARSVALLMQLSDCDEATTKRQEITAMARIVLILSLEIEL